MTSPFPVHFDDRHVYHNPWDWPVAFQQRHLIELYQTLPKIHRSFLGSHQYQPQVQRLYSPLPHPVYRLPPSGHVRQLYSPVPPLRFRPRSRLSSGGSRRRAASNMSLFKKGLIFASFVGCCIAMALEAAAMATKSWVVSEARRRFDNGSLDFASDGKVNFGLFKGSKSLNYGYGTRVFLIDVTALIVDEGEFMVWGLWIATLVCIVAAMLFSFIGALFGVINVATNPINSLPGPIGLYVWNIAAVVLNSLVIVTWVAQFNAKLKGNVMDRSDRSHQWTSKGMSTIGYSMWLIVGAIFVHLLNIAAVVGATHTRKPRRELVSHASPSKVQGAIMLY